jgi:hypothetical protein
MKTNEYRTVTRADLDLMAKGKCPCCQEPLSADLPPELTGRCHKGPVYVSYWDGYLNLNCGICHKPVCRVAVKD